MTKIKTGGRVAGTPNKMTKMGRELIGAILNENVDYFKENLTKLKPNEFCDVYLKMMRYVLPQLTNVEMGASEETKNNVANLLKELCGK